MTNNESGFSRDRTAVEMPLLVVRVIAGVIFAAHGAQKLFGAFDGPGLSRTVEMMGLGPVSYLVIIGEFFGVETWPARTALRTPFSVSSKWITPAKFTRSIDVVAVTSTC